MKPGIFSCRLLAVLLCSGIVSGCASNEPQRAQSGAGSVAPVEKLPAWTPDEKQLKTLTVTVEPPGAVPHYVAKVPADWQSNEHLGKGGQLFMWRGKPRQDQTCSVFMISTATQTPYQKEPLTVEEGMKVLLDSLRSGRKEGWTQTSVERGTIDGRTFLRAYWSGLEPNKKKMMHGFCYTTVEGKDLVMISGQDFEPFCKETVAQSEAAALTYRIVSKK